MKRTQRPDFDASGFDAYAGDLFGEIMLADTAAAPASRQPLSRFIPGLAICAIASAAAAWLSQNYGVPVILAGLLIGLALNFAAGDPRTHEGLDATSRHGLRAGIVLLGLQVTAMQVAAMGAVPFAGLALVMGAALLAALLAARVTGQSAAVGLLAGGSTAICGASAALALYSLIGKQAVDQSRFTLTLVGITVASALAMSLYPVLAVQLGLTDAQAGFLIGAATHDVAQAIGGGFSVSPEAGETATIVKLTRVALLAPMLMLAALWLSRQGEAVASRGRVSLRLPWFITAFLAVVAAGSVIDIPAPARDGAATAAQALLLLAIVATSMKAQLQLLLGQGWRPFAPVAVATLTSFTAALVAALAL